MFPSSLLSAWLLVVDLDVAAAQQPDPPAPPSSPDPWVVEGVDLRQIAPCTTVLPPPPASATPAPAGRAGAAARQPLPSVPGRLEQRCLEVPGDRQCVLPRKNPAADAPLPSRTLSPEEQKDPPPDFPPVSAHRVGLEHVFDWVKALNTCRFQAVSSLSRPEEPAKTEFETDQSFQGRRSQYEAKMAAREAQATRLVAALDPRLEAVRFAAILPASTIGEYDAETGCFFPGAVAEVELDDFKGRDTVYRPARSPGEAPDKLRLIPRDEALPVEVTSGTIAAVRLSPDTPRTVLQIISHPICVDPALGEILREQRERNAVADHGVQAEVVLTYALDGDQPVWQIHGDFVYRGASQPASDPADLAATEAARATVGQPLPVRPDAELPGPEQARQEAGGVPGPVGSKTSQRSLGCASQPGTASPGGGVGLAGLGLLAAAAGLSRCRSRSSR